MISAQCRICICVSNLELHQIRDRGEALHPAERMADLLLSFGQRSESLGKIPTFFFVSKKKVGIVVSIGCGVAVVSKVAIAVLIGWYCCHFEGW